ncbi:RNA polymerase sigma-70 factor, ECF subfamily [Pedobacter sp. ok626]|uniref:RNA polymerase sigma-70 factor n=1 Tax=Pedobacter sp. ok626 TaxID=1761882 RepID=UPI000887C549|nr:RNA polymerase sigma-70 factor [Pedobacter sp. ok626]SDL16591.1 RNA polymerase sigma-70 factor, ECF subfamily [Pedobacter sp. ok626]
MSNYREFSDVELIELLQSDGDFNGAFTVIYDHYFPPLVLHADRMLADMDLAKDIVQELFTKLFQQRKDIHINTSLKSYLYAAVRNRVFDNLKHAKVKMIYAEDFFAYVKDSPELADELVCLKELAKVIDSEIEKMPPKMREIFELSRKQFVSQKEIAKMLNVSENTVNNQIQRAIKKLRNNDFLQTRLIF